MSAVAACLSKITLGVPQTHCNLSLFPLLGDGLAAPPYLLLDEALAQGFARITEVSEAGSVPELRFVNDGTQPVLLLDGEELVGAKQNRILNLTVLAPARQSIVIPISCVEAGRWSARSAEFASAKRAHYAGGRAPKASQVSESLRAIGSPRSNQSAVWADIAEKAERLSARSDTQAPEALYTTHRTALDAYRAAFAPVPAQVGALFVLNGQVLGLDLFDSPRTLDALDAGEADGAPAGPEVAQAFVEAVSAVGVEAFAAVGEGEDLRLASPAVTGGALVAEGRVVHLCAFPLQRSPETGRSQGSRMVRASQRRRGRL
jgi:hypothetical protein